MGMTEDGPCLVDLFSAAGVAILASKDKKQVEADIAACRTMEQEGTLFQLQTQIGSRDIGRARSESFDVQIEGMTAKAGQERKVASASTATRVAEKSEPNNVAMIFIVGALVGFALGRASK